jgi:FkbM family methyltransferase
MKRSPRFLYLAALKRAAHLVNHKLAVDDPPPADIRRRLMLEADHVDVVLDVGGNLGQFGDRLRKAGWLGQIISFEPLSGPFTTLRKKAARDGNWDSHRIALGADNRTVDINVASVHDRSSLLPLGDDHHGVLPDSSYVGTEQVPCQRLDDALDETTLATKIVALKMDVQGYEMEVLRGAPRLLERTHLIELEVSLIEMYKGQPTAAELVAMLDQHGFEIVGAEPESIDRQSGRLNWLNVTFRRKPAR